MTTEQSIQQEILNYQSKILDLQNYSACLKEQLEQAREKLEEAVKVMKKVALMDLCACWDDSICTPCMAEQFLSRLPGDRAPLVNKEGEK